MNKYAVKENKIDRISKWDSGESRLSLYKGVGDN